MRHSILPRRPTVLLGTFALVALCGAVPGPEDGEVTVAVGGGHQRAIRGRGCTGGPSYAYDLPEATGAVVARKRVSNRIVVEGHGTLGAAWISNIRLVEAAEDEYDGPSGPEFAVGDAFPSVHLGARLGPDWTHGGFTAGPAVVWGSVVGLGADGRPEFAAAFSVSAWVGRRDVVYGWGEILPLPLTLASEHRVVVAGLGHAGDRVRAEVGLNPFGLLTRADVRVGEGRWVGLDGSVGFEGPDEHQRMLLVRFTASPRVFAPRPLLRTPRAPPPTFDDLPDGADLPDAAVQGARFGH